jgi:hypothetical protein
MFQESSKQISVGTFIVLLLMTMPVYAVKNYKTSNYGGAHQVWFEAEDYDERNPDTDQYYPVVDAADAFGKAITRTGEAGGMIRWTFSISKSGGRAGTWYFWARLINPNNTSDYMLVKGDPGDPVIPTGPPFPGGSGSAIFDDADDRVFEIDVGPPWGWAQGWDIEGHVKELQDGENTMYIFHRQGDNTVFWDVFVWTDSPDYVPTDEDYQNAVPAPLGTSATNPSPANGALLEDTWVSLSWSPATRAVSHDVYFGDNFDDVNDGIGDTFRGNLTSTFFVAGFPGYPYPDGLVEGTTYYWRIDEVNQADPSSPWKGDIWHFTVPSTNAYDPIPADGSKFVPADVTLSWTGGLGTKFHIIYFGDDYDTVANATAGLQNGTATYSPGTLEAEKTYYWRVDEFDVAATHKGDVWSFTTAKVGGGVKAQYYRGMNFNTLVLTRTDPQINFDWGDPGGPDPAVGDDAFSARWTGEVEAAFTETYTFYTRSDDGVRLWVDGQLLVDNWTDHSATENSGKIDLVAGNTYSLQMEYYENTGGAIAELRWSSPSTPKQLVPQAALAPPVKASGPTPGNGAAGTSLTPVLTWNPGDFAVSHEVYFGMDADAVRNATKTSPEYKGTKTLGDESYDPGKLAWATSYYWRVDEVNNLNPDSPWVGNLWSFTTGDFLLIDDFEGYNAVENQIWYAWHDGLGYGVPGADPYFAGNGTGAAVGDETTASYTEETIVHSGHHSMPLAYDNNKQGYSKYSETELKLTAPRDWTEEGVAELSLWFRGYPASTGSFVEVPAGTFTMTASGTDIWTAADEFHYAFKTLTGAGSIVAKVLSVDNTDPWAKAGVMIRETLDPGSKFAAVYITPGNGCRFQARTDTNIDAVSDTTVATTAQIAITVPYWVKLERDIAGNFRGSYSANGTTWTAMSWNPQNISMSSSVYVGLAVTSHNAAAVCEATFSNVTITGTAGQQWAHQDIGILSNDAEPLYVAVSNTAGNPAVVVNDDPAAAQIDTWTEWVIPLSAFSDQGINLTNVDRIAIGLGTRGNMTVAGGSGKIFIDDIRLYRSPAEPEPQP